MLLHDLELFRRQASGLEQDGVRDTDFPDIMHRSGLR
jgi:hypothetical protein